ncbi:hypothetical protein VIGAN_02188000 [Vigna angularis var. angularis]|uniref:Uncharacterized protein n=1 Tax=Vigna angularis var. angularis TaxID=157739 RepID=A0A0S3RET4_PHAAN|nr:hypothetical protein VIGAN_02188000 [Vigna angularis var. angularis]
MNQRFSQIIVQLCASLLPTPFCKVLTQKKKTFLRGLPVAAAFKSTFSYLLPAVPSNSISPNLLLHSMKAKEMRTLLPVAVTPTPI